MAALTRKTASSATEEVISNTFDFPDWIWAPAAAAIARAVSKPGRDKPSAKIPKQGTLASLASSASGSEARIRSLQNQNQDNSRREAEEWSQTEN